MNESGNHYQALGIAEDASGEEIKKAYFTAVRKHPPESDPEIFKKIREAYEILSNAATRGEYDRIIHADTRYDEYYVEGKQAYDDGDMEQAVRHLKTARQHAPGKPGLAEGLLGIIYLQTKEYKKAADLFTALVSAWPDVPQYHAYLGVAFANREMYGQAISSLKRAIALEKTRDDIWILLYECLFLKGDYPGSRDVLWEATWHVDNKGAIYDRLIDTDIMMENSYILASDLGYLAQHARNNPEDKSQIRKKLLRKIAICVGRNDMAGALLISESLMKLHPYSKKQRERHERLIHFTALYKQFSAMKNDPEIQKLVRKRAGDRIHDLCEAEDWRDPEETETPDILAPIDRVYRKNIMINHAELLVPSVLRIKEHYPAIYADDQEFYDRLAESTAELNEEEKDFIENYYKEARNHGMTPEMLEEMAQMELGGTQVIKGDRVGRNDPCPCGSGKKYKKCCGSRN